jgi:hypothetical protein
MKMYQREPTNIGYADDPRIMQYQGPIWLFMLPPKKAMAQIKVLSTTVTLSTVGISVGRLPPAPAPRIAVCIPGPRKSMIPTSTNCANRLEM